MAIPAIAAAIGQVGATGLAAYLSNKGARERNERQIEFAREQMAFQERMSSSAYQRAMQDMRQAGLNPILAYAQGGASTPSGAMPQIEDEIGPAVSSAQHARRLAAELDVMKATKENTYSQALKNRADAQLAHKNARNADQLFWKLKAETDLVEADKVLTQLMAPRAKNLAAVESTRLGKYGAVMERIMQMLLPFGRSSVRR